MTTRILIAVDFGLYGRAQVEVLRQLSPESVSKITVLHVVEPLAWELQVGYPPSNEIVDSYIQEGMEAARKLVSDMVTALSEQFKEEQIEVEIRTGGPVEEILKAAEEWQADMIVVGSHGRRGFARLLLGSVSGAVSAHARCSVLIARRRGAAEPS